MANPRAPKQWSLTKEETITSFENWRQNLLYILSLDPNFAPFLADNFVWRKKTADNPNRGLVNDGGDVPEANRRTAVQKNLHLELLLGQIANYCPVISRNSIVKTSTSLADIWQRIRQHYGFQSTGAHFLDLSNIKLLPGEKPEDLYQRIMAFFEDNLLTTECGITHHRAAVQTDEDLTPTLENTVVYLWLHLVNAGLPQLVKQRYGAELRSKSLATLKPEISAALPSLLEELRAIEDTRVLRVGTSPRSFPRTPTQNRQVQKTRKSCILCKTAGRSTYNTHYLQQCVYLPESDKRFFGRARLVTDEEVEDFAVEDEDLPVLPEQESSALIDNLTIRRVDVIQSPVLHTYYQHNAVRVTLDTGATTNLVRESFVKGVGLPTVRATQVARQADGVTPMDVVGEVHCKLTRGRFTFHLDALVVKQLDVDVLAGNPFLTTNDVAVRPAKRQIVIQGTDILTYGVSPDCRVAVRRTQAYLVRSPPTRTVILPGEFAELTVPESLQADATWALEPRLDTYTNSEAKLSSVWPAPQEVVSVGHSIRVPNHNDTPILLRKNEHVCQIRSISTNPPPVDPLPARTSTIRTIAPASSLHSEQISLDPDGLLPVAAREEFKSLHTRFDQVFNPQISKYNGASGKIEANVNMGPVLPPQRKGRLPHYDRERMVQLQCKFDELEEAGVFATPESVNISVEYLNLSFLVAKPNGGSRLVTSFGEVGHYSKPQPSLMPNVDDTLRAIARWKFVIVSDLLQSFYQIPLAHSSMKYCGVSTPFKGIRVYTRSAMGMPGSETCLEELMSRVLGDLIQEGFVAKIADDLYCGGDTPEELVKNWSRVLEALHRNNLRLSARKTVIAPKTTTILGWIWSSGSLRASSHRLATLSAVEPPKTVQGLRSFIGAYKVLSRVLRGYAVLMDPLDQATAGKQSKEHITWSEELIHAFRRAQEALSSAHTITIPCPADTIWIVTDGSVKNRGIAATMFVLRDGKLLLAGFFSAKLRKHQVTWLPCEVEALCIGSAVRHFGPYIVQSKSQAQVLSDSKPCVQAYEKLLRGEFSASSRVTTFLSVLSRYRVSLRHISGAANLPADFASRNPQECLDNSCQICQFIKESEDSVVRGVTVQDVLGGSVRMPFTSRAAWAATQQECPDLRRVHSHLTQGTRPTKKMTNIPDVKRYLNVATIATDGLLVVLEDKPFQPTRERIVVPRLVVSGLLTAIHLRFNHPSAHQMKQVVSRYFFALDLDKCIGAVCSACHHCEALKSIPRYLQPQSSSTQPDKIGSSFAADVMRRYRQCVLVLRETVSSYTFTVLISDEKHDTLRDAIITLCAGSLSLGHDNIVIRVDPAPGFSALVSDSILREHGISLELGKVKNKNKNPVAERAIEELGLECLHLAPEGLPLSATTLALATANMNSRIRRFGLSSREIWTQRDQVTGEQLPIEDHQLILSQHHSRYQNHASSASSKSRCSPPVADLQVGDLVYLKVDHDKTKARDKYMVVKLSNNECQLRKFTLSQFRSKAYDVKVSDCYPITPTFLSRYPQTGPIRGLEYPDTDPDSTDPCISQQSFDVHPSNAVCSPASQNQPSLSVAVAGPPLPPDPPAAIITPPCSSMPCPSGIECESLPSVPPPSITPVSMSPPPDPPSSPIDTLSSEPLRRSSRAKKPPAWQTSDTWEL